MLCYGFPGPPAFALLSLWVRVTSFAWFLTNGALNPHLHATTATMSVSHLSGKPSPQGGFDVASCLSVETWQPKLSFTTLTRQHQDYTFDYGSQAQEQQEGGLTQATGCEYQQLLTQCFQHPNPYTQAQAQAQAHSQPQGYRQHSIAPLALSQMSAPEPLYELDQRQIMPYQIRQQMGQLSSSRYGSTYERPQMLRYQLAAQLSRKRSHPDDFAYDYHRLQQLQAYVGSAGTPISAELTPHGHHVQLPPRAFSYQVPSQRPSPQHAHSGKAFPTLPPQPQNHHHHSLPNQPLCQKAQRTGYGEASSSSGEHGTPSVVGQPGMPPPAAPQKDSKLKFTSKDDALLVELKETKNLPWKQIADFFPGRSSGTLQVRYCTKLKAKTSVWTDEMVRQDAAVAESETTDETSLIWTAH